LLLLLVSSPRCRRASFLILRDTGTIRHTRRYLVEKRHCLLAVTSRLGRLALSRGMVSLVGLGLSCWDRLLLEAAAGAAAPLTGWVGTAACVPTEASSAVYFWDSARQKGYLPSARSAENFGNV